MLSWGSPTVDPDADTRPDHHAVEDGTTTPADYGDFPARRRRRQRLMVLAFLAGGTLLALGLVAASAAGG